MANTKSGNDMFKFVILFALFTLPAYAQQQTDPAFMQRAITSLQLQRNAALDQVVVSDAKVAGLTEDLTKAQARIKELEEANKNIDKK
jgi:hypothetical protein